MNALIKQSSVTVESRRTFLGQTGLEFSGTAIALLSGHEALAAKVNKAAESDLRILNTALGAELEADRTGSRHCGLIGRRAGSVPGLPYSSAMRNTGLVWNEKTLDHFLRSPMKAVPGTSMGYDGIKDDGERQDLIVFLLEADWTTSCQNLTGKARQP